jgi:hypothetical protein
MNRAKGHGLWPWIVRFKRFLYSDHGYHEICGLQHCHGAKHQGNLPGSWPTSRSAFEEEILVRVNSMILAALDLLLLFVVLLFLGFMAVRYDASKGIGERSYVRVYDFLDKAKDDLEGKHSLAFQPLIIERNSLALYRYEMGQAREIGRFETLNDLIKSGKLDDSLPCVIYERELSPLFSEALRALALKKIPLGLALVAQDSNSHDTIP